MGKRRGDSLALILAVVFVLAARAPARADWLSDMVVGTAPQAGSVAGSMYLYGGRISAYPMVKSYSPFSITPPRLFSTPCGFDLFFGGFSMMRPEALVALAQGVISAAPAYAFNLALGQLCAECKTTMQHLNSIAMKLNSLGTDSCTLLRRIADPIAEGLRAEGEAGAMNGLFGALNKQLEVVDKKIGDLLEFVSGKDRNTDTRFIKEVADFFLDGFADGRNSFSLLRQAFATFGVRTSYNDSSFPNDYPHGAVKSAFVNAGNLENFIRAITGDVIITKLDDNDSDCPDGYFELFGDCLSAWITGDTCGECKGKHVMGREDLPTPVKPPKEIPVPVGKRRIYIPDWSSVKLKIGGSECRWNMTDHLFEGKEMGCGGATGKGHRLFGLTEGGSLGLIALTFSTGSSQNLSDYVRSKFDDLKARIAYTSGYVFDAGDYQVLSSALTVYYHAVRLARAADMPEYETIIADELSKILPAVYVAYTVKSAVDSGITTLERLRSLLSHVKREDLDFVMAGGGEIIDWIDRAIHDLSVFRIFVLAQVNVEVDALNDLLAEMEKVNIGKRINEAVSGDKTSQRTEDKQKE